MSVTTNRRLIKLAGAIGGILLSTAAVRFCQGQISSPGIALFNLGASLATHSDYTLTPDDPIRWILYYLFGIGGWTVWGGLVAVMVEWALPVAPQAPHFRLDRATRRGAH